MKKGQMRTEERLNKSWPDGAEILKKIEMTSLTNRKKH